VKLLGFVTSVKALTDICDQLWNLLKQASLSPSWFQSFQSVCGTCWNSRVCRCSYFGYRSLFV